MATRFLSPDPFIQFPEFDQSWNRYSYVLNNPLTFTDPSGYFVQAFLAFWGPIAEFIVVMASAVSAVQSVAASGTMSQARTGSVHHHRVSRRRRLHRQWHFLSV